MAEGFRISELGRLYPILDTSLIGFEKVLDYAREIIAGGAGIVQLRSKGAPTGKVLEAAKELRTFTLLHSAKLIINDRVDVALVTGADGVHLGQSDLPVAEARALLGDGKIIGLSTHNVEEALASLDESPDYISFGPIFATGSKADAEDPKGLHSLRKMAEALKEETAPPPLSPPPIVAVGGITELTAPLAIDSGAAAVAMISEILLAEDIRQKVASVIRTMGESAE